MQQSASVTQLLEDVEKSFRQLFSPHVRSPSHWLSSSQSPCPSMQGKASEQQFQSVDGLPRQSLDGSIDVFVFKFYLANEKSIRWLIFIGETKWNQYHSNNRQMGSSCYRGQNNLLDNCCSHIWEYQDNRYHGHNHHHLQYRVHCNHNSSNLFEDCHCMMYWMVEKMWW